MEYLWAFIIGGLFCAIGQLLIDFTKLTPARILVAYVVAGVALGVLGVYKPLIDFAGGGATVPLTGFGYLLSDGVKQAVDENGFLGIFTGGLTAAAAGICAALTFGFLAACFSRSSPKV
ncbi:MAG: stage V sporulation protein AE [Ruminococcus sp.]|nr:stage V sporulation protein AE [Ruminococcus sp.]